MSRFNAPARRRGGDLDVYTGLLCAAFLVLVAGVALMALRNIKHSEVNKQQGGPFKLVE